MGKVEAELRSLRRKIEALTLSVAAQALGRSAYSPAEAAQRMGVSLSTVRRAISLGTVQTVRIGSRRLVPASEVERLCAPVVPSRKAGRPKSSGYDARAEAAEIRR